jgi:hypothetical protein
MLKIGRLLGMGEEVVDIKKTKDLDELWEVTEGTPVCPHCGSPLLHGHIREINMDLAVVDWTCEACGHKWSNCCPFVDGVLTAVDS